MPRITISYRREETGDITGRIFDRLVAHYGRGNVFRDIDNTPAGRDFDKYDRAVFGGSDIVLAIVGPRWVSPRGHHTHLQDPADPVRVEIETAMQKGALVLPVLVMRAEMPRPDELPETIRQFAFYNALSVDSGQDFDVHITRLIGAVDAELKSKTAAATTATASGDDAEAIALLDAALAPAPVMPPGNAPAWPGRRGSAAVGPLVLGLALGAAAAVAALVAVKPPWLTPPAVTRELDAEKDAKAEAQERLGQATRDLAAQADALAAAQAKVDGLTAQVKDLSASAAAAAATTSSAPAAVPANHVVAFSVPNNPKPGLRDFWFYTIAGTWIERSSDAKTYNEFQTQDPATVNNCPGMRLTSRRTLGQVVQVFVPDHGCRNMTALILGYPPHGDPVWIDFGKMEDVVVGAP